MAITVYIGPDDNVAGVTPDFNTLIEWWADVGTVKDLEAAQETTTVHLLPGIHDHGSTVFNMTGGTTTDEFNFQIMGYQDYVFIGDYTGDIPIISSTATIIINCDVDFTFFSGFVIESSGVATNITSAIITNFPTWGVISNYGIRNVCSDQTIFSLCSLVNTVMRNAVINNCGADVSVGAKGPTASIVNASSCYINNNLIANCFSNYSGGTGGVDATIRYFADGGSDSIYCNNVGCLSSGTTTGSSIRLLEAVAASDAFTYNAYDDTFTSAPDTGSNHVLFDSSINIANTSTGDAFSPLVFLNSSLIDAGIEPSSISNPVGMAALVNAIGDVLSFTSRVDVNYDEFITYPIGVDALTIKTYEGGGTLTLAGTAIYSQDDNEESPVVDDTDEDPEDGFVCKFVDVVNNEVVIRKSKVRSLIVKDAVVPAITVCTDDLLRSRYFS